MDASSLDLKTLQIVAAVAETGSMTDAALRFGVTQSAVSQAVRKVEEDLGVLLLDRQRRPLTPTIAGRILANRLNDLSRDLELLLETLRHAGGQPERVALRLGVVDTFAGTVGAHLIKELADGASAVSLTFWSGLAGPHAQALIRRTIDMAITCDPMEQFEGVARHLLFRDPYILLVPRGQAGEFKNSSLADIFKRHKLVRHSERSFVGQQIERHLRRMGLKPPRAFEFDMSDTLVAMVATGMGVAITTPLCLLQGQAHAENVDVLPLPGPELVRGLYLVTRQDTFVSLAPYIALCTRDILKQHALPRMAALVPWLQAGAFGLQPEKNQRELVAI